MTQCGGTAQCNKKVPERQHVHMQGKTLREWHLAGPASCVAQPFDAIAIGPEGILCDSPLGANAWACCPEPGVSVQEAWRRHQRRWKFTNRSSRVEEAAGTGRQAEDRPSCALEGKVRVGRLRVAWGAYARDMLLSADQYCCISMVLESQAPLNPVIRKGPCTGGLAANLERHHCEEAAPLTSTFTPRGPHFTHP